MDAIDTTPGRCDEIKFAYYDAARMHLLGLGLDLGPYDLTHGNSVDSGNIPVGELSGDGTLNALNPKQAMSAAEATFRRDFRTMLKGSGLTYIPDGFSDC
jgi:hypothetical protein